MTKIEFTNKLRMTNFRIKFVSSFEHSKFDIDS